MFGTRKMLHGFYTSEETLKTQKSLKGPFLSCRFLHFSSPLTKIIGFGILKRVVPLLRSLCCPSSLLGHLLIPMFCIKLFGRRNTQKKIKFLLWELSLRCLNSYDRLQRICPWFSISPNWCCLCKEEGGRGSQSHLFIHCPFSLKIWACFFEAFGWSVVLPMVVQE